MAPSGSGPWWSSHDLLGGAYEAIHFSGREFPRVLCGEVDMGKGRSGSPLGALLVLAAAATSGGQSGRPLVLRWPAVSQTRIAFSYAGDLWTVAREGGEAQRLTTGAGSEARPLFSPDGSKVAFTGEYDGNTDIYLMPAAGGEPRRLTYHPDPDEAVGWSPDGKRILF